MSFPRKRESRSQRSGFRIKLCPECSRTGAECRCIDAGYPNSDWTAELWPNGKRINLGAYGGTREASMSLSDVGNAADLNIDGMVDFRDFGGFGNCWKKEELLMPEDLNRDGCADFSDVKMFVDEWLWEQ